MKILFFLGHPAHYHLYINVIHLLQEKNHEIVILIKTKDILETLCRNSKINYFNILSEGRKDNKVSILIGLLKRDFRISKLFLKNGKPDILIGSEVSLSHVGRLFGVPSIILSEDDAEEVPFFSKMAYPFVNHILSPEMCSAGKWERKRVSYNSYHELAYLHPKYFSADQNKVNQQIDKNNPFFILRFSRLTAYHDFGKTGITDGMARNIIDLLKPHGNLYITSERPLAPEFEKYRISIDPLDMHHALYYATLYIGDSQTMTAEAAVLGTPALRFNDFVGRLGYLEELEHKYGLTYGFKTSELEKLYAKIEELLNFPNLRKEWQGRRKRMLADKIDVTAFLVWFIEEYPRSVEIMKRDPSYQERFR